MKKLFIILSFFTATLFTNQIIRPAVNASDPRENFMMKSRFSCQYLNQSFGDNTVKLKCKITCLNNELVLLQEKPFDIKYMFITLISHEGKTKISCFLNNTETDYDAMQILEPTSMYCDGLTIQGKKAWERPCITEAIIEIALGAYIRKNLLIANWCIHCNNEIKTQEPAFILNCGSGIHETCLSENPTPLCTFCDKKASEDVWCYLEEIPETADFKTV